METIKKNRLEEKNVKIVQIAQVQAMYADDDKT